MTNEAYLPLVLREFARLKELADRAIAQCPLEHFFTAPGADDNSVAVLVKHVAGNSRSRWTEFLTSDGEKPDRRRDAEFVIGPDDTRERLLERWEQGWAALFDALRPLGTTDLARIVTIRGEPLTVLQAVNRQLTHYAYHVGQIVYLAKHYAAAKWKTLSIARGESDNFNRAPRKYLDRT